MAFPTNVNTKINQSYVDLPADGETAKRVVLYDSSGNPIDFEINDRGQLKVVLDGRVDENNSSSTLLNAGQEFIGEATDTLDYALIFVTVYSDVGSDTNGLHFGVSSDGITWRPGDQYTVPAGVEKTYSFQPNKKYYRIHYLNGGSNQSVFDLHTILKKTNSKPSSHRIQDVITDDDDATLQKSVITGRNPHGDFVNFEATTAGNFKVSLEEFETGLALPTTLPSLYFDMFGKLAVAQPKKLIEYSATYPIDTTRYFDIEQTGSGTAIRNATKTQVELYTTTASGDKAVIQTRRNIQYNKGNAQEILIIYKPNPLANRRERWGYFDDNNGIFLEHDGTNARIVLRSDTSGTPVDTQFDQVDWDDPLDGNGASGCTIDWTKQTVFKIEFGWLSARGFRVLIDCGGEFVNVKSYMVSNMLTVPFMRTACLPIRFEVENTDTTSQAQTSSFSCFAVQSSGAADQEGAVRTLSSGTSTSPCTSTETVVAGIRLNANFINASIQPIAFNVLPASGTDTLIVRARYNSTLTGPTWSLGESIVYDYLTGTMPTFTGGSIIAEAKMSLGNKNQVSNSTLRNFLSDIYIGKDISNNSDSIIITAQTNTGSGTFYHEIEFKEFA